MAAPGRVEATMMFPGLACDENGNPRKYVVRCVQTGVMGGYDTLEDAQRVAAAYQNQPRPNTKFAFTVEPNPAYLGA